jgi:1-deoxy-D-xylulose-5-phosphate reductoisomerase
MKNIAILGSTGSIGQNTLEVIRHFPDKFGVIGLSTNSNIDILYRQIKEFKPLFVCIKDRSAARGLESRFKFQRIKLFVGDKGLKALIEDKRIDKVVLAISGSGALLPLLTAIENYKDIALANKEAMVAAGPIIMREARKKKIKIIPIDSEQSAIWQCLDGEDPHKLKNIYLTSSGGPFRKTHKDSLKDVSIKKVLKHPRWKMGKKISVDSATLMNKGLELLETMFLFNIPPDKIKILIHPEAIIHSMVEFIDGVIKAELSATDMRIPIQYALSYPERLLNSLSSLDFYKLKELHFQAPDFKKFPCLGLAYQVAKELGTMPCVFNTANEVCVDEFLKQRINFISIPKVIEKVLDRHHNKKNPDLADIQKADAWARNEAHKVIAELN